MLIHSVNLMLNKPNSNNISATIDKQMLRITICRLWIKDYGLQMMDDGWGMRDKGRGIRDLGLRIMDRGLGIRDKENEPKQ